MTSTSPYTMPEALPAGSPLSVSDVLPMWWLGICNVGATGHTLGAAGGLEAIAVVQAMQTGTIPPTINYDTPDPDCDLNYTPNKVRP